MIMAEMRLYGTWTSHVDIMSATLEETVREALSVEQGVFDADAVAAEYRTAICAALPAGVTLRGDSFYVPTSPEPGAFDGYPVDGHGRLDVEAIVSGIDFDAIAARHRR